MLAKGFRVYRAAQEGVGFGKAFVLGAAPATLPVTRPAETLPFCWAWGFREISQQPNPQVTVWVAGPREMRLKPQKKPTQKPYTFTCRHAQRLGWHPPVGTSGDQRVEQPPGSLGEESP